VKQFWFSDFGFPIGRSERNKAFFLALSSMLFALSFSADAQLPKKVPRIGYLSVRSGPGDNDLAFRQRLRELGYIEGKNIVIEWRFADGKSERYPALAAKLVQIGVEAIVTNSGDDPIVAAMKATKTIPIIFETGSDPVARGFVPSLARPDGNVTGVSWMAHVLGGKRLELLKEAVPKVTRVAVLYEPATPANVLEVNEDLPVAARALKLTVQPWEVRSADDFEDVFAALSKEHPDGLYVAGSPLTNANQKPIVGFALKSRLPSVYFNRQFVDAGGLMTYGVNLNDLARHAATYVDKVLKGAKPAELPVEQPTKFEFIINLKAAKQIGLTIPPDVLARADKVIR
jgi:putative ABC transport system substrate-binding protein